MSKLGEQLFDLLHIRNRTEAMRCPDADGVVSVVDINTRPKGGFVMRNIKRNPELPPIPTEIEEEISRRVRERVSNRPPIAERSRQLVRRILRRNNQEFQYISYVDTPAQTAPTSACSGRNGKKTMGKKIRIMLHLHSPETDAASLAMSSASLPIPRQQHQDRHQKHQKQQQQQHKQANSDTNVNLLDTPNKPAFTLGLKRPSNSADKFRLLKSISNIDLSQTMAGFGITISPTESLQKKPSIKLCASKELLVMPTRQTLQSLQTPRPPANQPNLSKPEGSFSTSKSDSYTESTTAGASRTSTKTTKTSAGSASNTSPNPSIAPVIIVYGGIFPNTRCISEGVEMRIRRALRLAIEAGYSVLFNGGSAVSAVEAAARRLEDYDLFNAGKGSAISILGHPLLDATICDGSKQRGASVALVSAVRNPINLARRILEHGSIPMVASLTAQKYAELFKIKQIDPISLNIDHRVHEYHKWRATSSVLDCMECANSASDAKNADATRKDRSEGGQISPAAVFPDGGVGAVAVDKYGKVAAASSSGGSVGRLAGQITESGCIGASTWADNLFAVSGISSNSQCIYQQTAHTIALRARYRKEHIRSATASTLADLLMSTGAEGAFVAIDNKGAFAVVYSADNMVRGYCSSATNHEPHVAIYADEPLPACNDIHIEQPDHV